MTLKTGFVGAGYIAGRHADALMRVKDASLSLVADANAATGEQFAAAYGARAASLEEMLASDIDVVHVLTPPPTHFDIVRRVLEAGKHAFVEKPLTLAASDAQSLQELATERKRRLGVNHNFLMQPGYDRLRRCIDRRVIGPIDSLHVNWRMALPPLRSGPYSLWMLREPQNILHELGPHLFAFVADLVDYDFSPHSVLLRHPIELPGLGWRHQAWTVAGAAGHAAVTLELSLIEGHEDRSIEARGAGALARYDFGQDVFTLDRASTGDIVVAPFAVQMTRAWQEARAGFVNVARQSASLNALAPFGLGVTRAVQSFYAAVRADGPVDRRLSAGAAFKSAAMIEATLGQAQLPAARPPASPPLVQSRPLMLVIGGTGFIGRSLVERLVRAGHRVRVFSRGKTPLFEGQNLVEVFAGSLSSREDLARAMNGVDGVFHLARAEEKSWPGYLQNDVEPTSLVGACAAKAGVRLVYAGTIDCYDASRADRPITEETPFDPDLARRNLYARSKAACEAALLELARTKSLKLVIARPGIVIGRGGPLKHWGVAMWRSATACRLWGRGDHAMPFVSVADAADGLMLAMNAPDAESRSFNLVGDPMLSARDYLREVGLANGVTIEAAPTPLWSYFAVDLAKYWAKRVLARRKGLTRPSLRDWRSRAQLSPFKNDAAKERLGWKPEANRERFVEETIVRANLFGVRCSGDATTRPAGSKSRE